MAPWRDLEAFDDFVIEEQCRGTGGLGGVDGKQFHRAIVK
jgi:hypothetical protein